MSLTPAGLEQSITGGEETGSKAGVGECVGGREESVLQSRRLGDTLETV